MVSNSSLSCNNQRLGSAFDVTRFSLSFAKLVMMSSTPAKSAGDARYAFQDPFIQTTLSHTISTPICIGVRSFYVERNNVISPQHDVLRSDEVNQYTALPNA